MAYDRFLDVHVKNGSNYDFEKDVQRQRLYQEQRHKFTSYDLHNANLDLVLYRELRKYQYVNIAVDIGDIDKGDPSKGIRKLISWVSSPNHKGKLRINVHGDGEGNICMDDDKGYSMEVPAAKIVTWLVSNGLQQGGADKGLKTISLALCEAARFQNTPALVLPGGDSATAAAASAVSQVVGGLRQNGFHGIEVTGSNEIVSTGNAGKGIKGQLGRCIDIPSYWKLSPEKEGEYSVRIRPPFSVRSDGPDSPGHIWLPSRYKLSDRNQDGWDVTLLGKKLYTIPSTGWIAELLPSMVIIKPPVGWSVESYGIGLGGALRFPSKGVEKPTKNGDGSYSIWQRLAHTSAKSRMVS